MKLNRLLEAHDRGQHGLTKNFGDAYLLEKNRIYSRIRSLTLKNGYCFHAEPSANYLALPLSQLNDILPKKHLPYLDNVSVLKELNARTNADLDWDAVADNLKKNFLFHESCHAVARSYGVFSSAAQGPELILRILLEESFANTCELLAVIDVDDHVHRIFYEWNSYTCLSEERTHLKKAVQDMGGPGFFKYLFLCYLHANFLTNELNDKSFHRLIKLVFADNSVSAQQLKTLRALGKMAFTLDLRFRQVTTGLHLRLCGFRQPLKELLDFDFIQLLESHPSLLETIQKLADLPLSAEIISVEPSAKA